MARPLTLAAAIAVSLLAVSGAGGVAAQTPKRGGTVAISAGLEPACLNPLQDCSGGSLISGIEEVLEGAFEVGPDRVRPNLVSRVEPTTRPPYTLTYFIRRDAHWSDGVPITASDFVFTHRAFRRDVPNDSQDVHLTKVRSVRALDPNTVRVVLRSRFAGWRGGLFSIVLPRHALRGADLENIWRDGIDDPRTGNSIGSGPFLFQRWERGRQMTLVRNPRYWGAHPAYLNRLILRFDVANPAEALESGVLDAHQYRLEPGVEREFLQIAGMKQLYAPGIGWEHFEIRIGPGGHPALKSKLVRRALAYGLDRSALVRTIFGEFDPTIRPSESAVFLPRSPYYRPNWSDYRGRPSEARRLLEQTGCRPGADGIYVCDGKRLSFRAVTTAGVTRRIRALEIAQSQLRRVGVELDPIYTPGPVLFEHALPSGEWDIGLFLYFYAPDQTVDIAFRCHAPGNYTGYCQRLVTRQLDQAGRILDPDRRARALNRADVQMARDVPVIPVWNELIAATVRSTLRGYVPMFPLFTWNAENWWLAE